MTTKQQDTRNVYQYVMDSLALIEERGPSLSKAFRLLAKTDHSIMVSLKKELDDIDKHSEEDRDDMYHCCEDLMVREAFYILISRFLITDLSLTRPSPYLMHEEELDGFLCYLGEEQ